MTEIDSWIIPRNFYKDDEDVHWTQTALPFQDESFSSWFVRLVMLNCANPSITYHKVLGCKADLGTIDRGIIAKEVLIKKMEPFVDFRQVQFTSFQMRPKKEADSNIKRRIRYCPICLQNDPIPYFRITWQFDTVCTIHNVPLRNTCPACGRTILYWKNDWNIPICACYKCKWDFRSDSVPPKYVGVSDAELGVAIKAGLSNIRIMKTIDYWDDDRINKLRPSPPKMTRVKIKPPMVFSDDDIQVFIDAGRSNSWITALTYVDSDRIDQIRKDRLLGHPPPPDDSSKPRKHTRNKFPLSKSSLEFQSSSFNDEEIKTSIRIGRTNSWIYNNMHAKYIRINNLRDVCQVAKPMPAKVGRQKRVNGNIVNSHGLPQAFTDAEIKASIASGRSNKWIVNHLLVSIERIDHLRSEI